jgi:hypothetical protein
MAPAARAGLGCEQGVSPLKANNSSLCSQMVYAPNAAVLQGNTTAENGSVERACRMQ